MTLDIFGKRSVPAPARPAAEPAKAATTKPAIAAVVTKATAADLKLRKELTKFAAKPPERLQPTVFILADSQSGKSHRITLAEKPTFVVSDSNPPRLTVSITLRPPVSNEERLQIGQKLRADLLLDMKRYNLPQGIGQLRIDIAKQ